MTADRVYRELRPAGELADTVACVWIHAFGGDRHTFRVVPDGCVDLIWSHGQLRVAGPDTGPQLAEIRPGQVLVGLRFRPGAAPPVLGVPAHVLRDDRVDLAELWPAERVGRLAEVLAPARPVPAARALHDAVGEALRGAPPADHTMTAVAARLRAGETVSATAAAIGLSERQLHRRSRAAFGYGPKLLARILRFRAALGLAQRGVPFAEVAAATGYADQPHLSREVAELAGVPLRTLLDDQASPAANRSTGLPSGSRTTA